MKYLKVMGTKDLAPELVILSDWIALLSQPDKKSNANKLFRGILFCVLDESSYQQESYQQLPCPLYNTQYQSPQHFSMFVPSPAFESPPTGFNDPTLTATQVVPKVFVTTTPTIMRNVDQYHQPLVFSSHIYPSLVNANHGYQAIEKSRQKPPEKMNLGSISCKNNSMGERERSQVHLDVYVMQRMLAINELKIQQRYWQVLPSGLNTFETRNLGEFYGVDLEKKTCTCRIWKLNGYGCVHSVAAISYVNRDVEAFVDPLYRTCIYMNTYKYSIGSMNGSAMWPPTDYIPPLPPLKRKITERPTIKRKRDSTEATISQPVMQCQSPKKSRVKKRKVEGECDSGSALKKGKGEVQRRNGVQKGNGEGEGGSGIGFKTGQGECGSTSFVNKKNSQKEGTVKLRKKSERIIKKKLAKG
ncbi:unnamed protein product [Lactuca virosa]|uniref:SWIM-type domain-containing protein n=1 Tax=Lactuca virosa TaxID=75947 RepID=A0AAU9PTS5_9ASTR|nr:unnamed protein product [Lactuca virosa]